MEAAKPKKGISISQRKYTFGLLTETTMLDVVLLAPLSNSTVS